MYILEIVFLILFRWYRLIFYNWKWDLNHYYVLLGFLRYIFNIINKYKILEYRFISNTLYKMFVSDISIITYFLYPIYQVYRSVRFYYIVESRTVWPNLWRVVNLIHILLILAHWFGCFYYLLSEAEGFQVCLCNLFLYIYFF